mmetsp:Transcript_92191/g.282186  ORF Transcript_92191/g.282186 Transcript_92191/m.282186 type:complete len:253 (+) Transcript_92191:1181-1939(+)
MSSHALPALLHAVGHQHRAHSLERRCRHVHLRQRVELRGAELLDGNIVPLVDVLRREVHGKRQGQLWENDVLLGRVVQHLRLRTLGRLDQVVQLLLGIQDSLGRLTGICHLQIRTKKDPLHLELPPNRRIAGRCGASLREIEAAHRRDLQTGVRHGAKQHLVVTDLFVISFSVDGDETHEQIAPRNRDVGDPHTSIVHSVVSQLLPDIAELNSSERFVRLPITDLEKKGMRAVVLPGDHHARHQNATVATLR